jgi:hypothetical protein
MLFMGKPTMIVTIIIGTDITLKVRENFEEKMDTHSKV